jgi:hypothetical protein
MIGEKPSDISESIPRADLFEGLIRFLLESLILATLLFGKALPIPDLQ